MSSVPLLEMVMTPLTVSPGIMFVSVAVALAPLELVSERVPVAKRLPLLVVWAVNSAKVVARASVEKTASASRVARPFFVLLTRHLPFRFAELLCGNVFRARLPGTLPQDRFSSLQAQVAVFEA